MKLTFQYLCAPTYWRNLTFILYLQQVSSTGNSKLWEKNKMLASLLAKEPPKATTIPPIPTSVISATPQDKLPKIGDRLKAPGGKTLR